MANIHHTIEEVRKLNPDLAHQIETYVKDHAYGLVFEENLPEAVRLWKKEVSIGDTVNILPPRGQFDTPENKVPWRVIRLNPETHIATIEHDGESKTISTYDLVTIVSYKDVIYPGLKEIDRVERGDPDDPYHMVINAENYHALQALIYAYQGKVDCIYIDPPYNKEGRHDWKYNCDYVDKNDRYRHSKWLVFMKRRLKLAKNLLNQSNSVLIVTIDENEYARLGLLLEQMFPDARIQMITTIVNPSGNKKSELFSRTDEYVYFVMIGDAKPLPLSIEQTNNLNIHWRSLRRGDLESKRGSKKGGVQQFYPIYVNTTTHKIQKIGEALPIQINRNNVPHIDGCVPIFPVRDDGTELNWGVVPETAEKLLSEGFLKASKYAEPKKPNSFKKIQPYDIKYLTEGSVNDIKSGKAILDGYDEDGSVIAHYENGKSILPKTNWSYSSHDAKEYGTKILSDILKGKLFSYPKSLYAVEDAIRLFISDKPNAIVVDYFAGSGTTTHACMLLNHLDGGRRRSIIVTNNEVSEEEETKFINNKLRPSDPDWYQKGIANFISWTRIKSSILGEDSTGNKLQDNYKFAEEFPMADGFKANAIFCELTYESEWPVRLDRAFEAIAPILWMQAGCKGKIISNRVKTYSLTDYYGVLFDYYQASKFCDEIKKRPNLKHVFVVTDDQRRYSNICRRLPGIEVHRLYETFLKTFQICGEGGLD